MSYGWQGEGWCRAGGHRAVADSEVSPVGSPPGHYSSIPSLLFFSYLPDWVSLSGWALQLGELL